MKILITINDKRSGIYCIEDLKNHRKYIGQSVNIFERHRKHICELNNGVHHNDYLQKAWNKYGSENFDFRVLEYCDIDMLDERECYYIDLYNTLDRQVGYNIASGGQLNKKQCSDDVRERVRLGVTNSYNDELRKQRSKKLKEQWADPEIKAKLSKGGMHGRHHTNEVRQKLRNLHIGTQIARKYFAKVLCIETGEVYENASVAAETLALDSSSIIKVCKGERYICGGFHWKFVS